MKIESLKNFESKQKGQALIYKDLPNEDYHASVGISSSYVRRFGQSQLHAINYTSESTPALKFGTAAHSLLVEGQEAFDKEVIIFRKNIDQFKIEQQQIIKDFNDYKKKEIDKVFQTISPIINTYMEKNSVKILFDAKNIFMARNDLNLTNDSLNSLYEDFKGFSSSSLSKALKLLFNNGNTFLEWPKLLQLTKDMYSDELLDRPRLDQPKNENGLKDYLKGFANLNRFHRWILNYRWRI